MIEDRKTYLSVIRRQGCGIVPSFVSVNYAFSRRHIERLENLKKECPNINIAFSRSMPPAQKKIETDKWGCKWTYTDDYLGGQVVEHPIDTWEKFDNYSLPPASAYAGEDIIRKYIRTAEQNGDFISLPAGEHGFFFLKLTYLRGFENLMVDIASREKRIYVLRDMLTEFWVKVVKKFLEHAIDEAGFADDLGLQDRLPVHPDTWRSFFKPAFKEIFSLCREKNVDVYLHTDGYIVDIIPDLIDAGVTVLNLQDLVNRIDTIENKVKGKICTALDVDRQKITVFGTPADVERHILDCIRKLGSPEGGLTLKYGVYSETPIENVESAVRAMEKYRNYWLQQ